MIRLLSSRSRMMALGLIFLTGCLFTLVYLHSPGLKNTIVQAWNSHTTANGSQNQNQNTGRSLNDNKVALTNQNKNKNQNPNTPMKPPEVKDISQKQDNWTEDENLKLVRRYGVVKNIPDLDVLDTYDNKKLSAIYHSYLDNVDILCQRKLRMGKVGDGGWEVCDDYEWRPIRPCVIYSFGINNDFSFDDDAGRIYGCDVYSFDPSMSKKTHRHSNRVMFYDLGIGGDVTADQAKVRTMKTKWTIRSLSQLRAMLNHTKTVIDVIKMDVEHSEWSALPVMLKEKQLSNVRQLLMEYHQVLDKHKELRFHLKVIGDLEKEGFKKFYVSKNFHCARNAVGMPIKRTSCYEIHYVNAKFQRKNDQQSR